MRRYSSAFDEAVLKHLELIQGNITRMGRYSFLLKGWSVTLVAAIIALSVRNPNTLFVLIALFPALVFWGLDAFYLQQERLFRRLYRGTVEGKVDAFSMVGLGLTRFRGPIRVKGSGSVKGVEDGQDRQAVSA